LLEVVRLAFSDLAEVSAELLFDDELLASFEVWALVAASVSVEEALEVEFIPVAGPDDVVVLLALPLLDEVLPPLAPLLV
jgi:hypothetical protein